MCEPRTELLKPSPQTGHRSTFFGCSQRGIDFSVLCSQTTFLLLVQKAVVSLLNISQGQGPQGQGPPGLQHFPNLY